VSNFCNLKQSRVLIMLAITPLVAACSFNMNQNSIIEGVVQTVPLNNGKLLSVGYKVPDVSAQCQLVNDTSRNWAIADSVGGLTKAGAGRQVLQEEAVASVNERPQDGINYVALIIPDQTNLGRVNLTMGKDAQTNYFRCVNPPKPN
jgi:hypothetical protein